MLLGVLVALDRCGISHGDRLVLHASGIVLRHTFDPVLSFVFLVHHVNQGTSGKRLETDRTALAIRARFEWMLTVFFDGLFHPSVRFRLSPP